MRNYLIENGKRQIKQANNWKKNYLKIPYIHFCA